MTEVLIAVAVLLLMVVIGWYVTPKVCGRTPGDYYVGHYIMLGDGQTAKITRYDPEKRLVTVDKWEPWEGDRITAGTLAKLVYKAKFTKMVVTRRDDA